MAQDKNVSCQGLIPLNLTPLNGRGRSNFLFEGSVHPHHCWLNVGLFQPLGFAFKVQVYKWQNHRDSPTEHAES